MPEYIYLIHPYRHETAFQPTPEEEVILSEHLAYLQEAASRGALLLAGPCLDGTFGLAVFRAENEAAAQQFMFDDPAVKADLMAAELHPFRISVTGGFSS
jgi:uncharacterized protein YciI